jgi:hypothetical protein
MVPAILERLYRARPTLRLVEIFANPMVDDEDDEGEVYLYS